jgi:predicted permease
MFSDLRFACRSLAKTPGFTAVAVVTLALGIGITTTVFSWIDRVLFNPLPGAADAARIVALESLSPSGEMIDTSYPDYRDYQAQAKNLSDILVFKERPLNLGEGERTRRVWAELVSGNFFTVLGVQPQLGRFFAAGDHPDDPSAAPVAVISDALWRVYFQSNPRILGRTVTLNQHEFTVIGVAPPSFLGSLNGLAFDVWVPVMLHSRLMGPSQWLESRGWRALHTLARVAPGATLATARAELAGLAAQLALAHPATNKQIGLAMLPVTGSPHGVHRELAQPLLLLLGVCGLLLLIVCANLSNLLLVRASARQREMSIRQALGAGRLQLVRQLLAESLLLAFAGTSAGLLLTLWMADLLRFFLPDTTLPISLAASVSPAVLVVAVLLSLGTAILAGLASILWATRSDLMGVLRTTGSSTALSPRAEFFRSLLVVAQVAVAFVTLSCTALAAKSFYAARHANPGFDAAGVLLAGIKLDASGYGTREQGIDFLNRLQLRVAVLPGVESAAIAENVPLGLSRGSWETVSVSGYVAAPQEDMRIYRNLVSPGYFSLMHIPLLGGRDFRADDRRGAPFVAIVSEAFARRYYGTTEAVGRTFSIWDGQRNLTVVGVVRDIKVYSLRESALPYYYVPLAQFFSTDTGVGVHLRTKAGDPLQHLSALRAEVRALDPNVPVFEALTLEDYTSAARFAQRAAASLLGVLSAMALALTALGLYGVLAFAVAQRTSEIGVRIALGAQPADIAQLVLSRGGVLLAFGLGAGLLAALGAARLLAAVFFGLRNFEPLMLAAVAPPLVFAAALACWLPARRAAKVDPLVALRAE